MIWIRFDEPTAEKWRRWRTRCDTAREEVIAAVESGADPQVSDLYKGMRDVYLGLRGPFHGKCAYCEGLPASDQPGDIEHFRPKGGVTDKDFSQVMVTDGRGGARHHPGYYWLAYEWRNLLPSCIDCNRRRRHEPGGPLVGKGTRFPVHGFRASRPGEETREEPLLIHPCEDDPCKHLKLDPAGVFVHLSDKGRITIDVFGLNRREALVEQRKRTYENTQNALAIALLDRVMRNDKSKWDSNMRSIDEGEIAYAAAARLACRHVHERLPGIDDGEDT